MLRGYGTVGGAEQRICAGGKDLEGSIGTDSVSRRGVERKGDFHALAAPDPVGLHQAHTLGPVLQGIECIEQLVGIRRDPHVVHGDLALLDDGASAPAAAVDHLLVGENRLVQRIPVDRAGRLVDEALLQQAKEEPLVPAVVLAADRWRARGSSRCRSQVPAAAAACRRCCRGSRRRGPPPWPWRRSPPAVRRRPSPWAGARSGPASAGAGRSRRRWCSCARGPCAAARSGTGTWTGNRTSREPGLPGP